MPLCAAHARRSPLRATHQPTVPPHRLASYTFYSAPRPAPTRPPLPPTHPLPPPPRQTRTAASVALRSGGGLGASKLVGGPAGGKQKVLARAATAERWETLLLGMMLNGEKPRADAHTFVPSMSLGVDAYTFKKPPPRKSSFEHAAPLVRMPSFEEQPSKTSWNSSPR